MGFRAPLPQWLQGLGIGLAGPHIRFKKRRVVSLHHLLPGCCNILGKVLLFPVGSLDASVRRHSLIRAIELASRQDRPHDPGILVGKSDGDDVRMPPLSHLADPLASGIILSLGFAENGPRTMDHQGAQISVAAFTDPEQPGLPAARPLPWNQSKPGGRLASVLETIPVTDRRYQRRRGDRPNALDLANTLALLVGSKEVPDPLVIPGDALIELRQFLMHIAHQIPEHVAKAVGGAVNYLCETTPQARDVPAYHDAMFGQKTADLVHQPRPVRDQPLADAMNGLDLQLRCQTDSNQSQYAP
jgi:hypothetical protein